MKKFLVPICSALCIVGIFAVWYFGYQSSNPEELKSKSKDSLPIENRPQDTSSVSESTQKTGKDETADEIETKKEGSNSEKTNDTGGNTTLNEKKKQEQSPSAEDIAAGAAFEAYAMAEIDHKSAVSKLIEALKSEDSASIEAATETLKNARLSREEALRNLAPYSEAAAEILAADEVRSAEAKKVMDQMRAEDQKRSTEMEERRKQFWVGWYNKLSPEQQRTLLDKYPDFRKLLQED